MTRIIAGLAKGRRLAVPHAGTRPTSDRAREGLFNTLATSLRLDGARVLDLYAGTGAVGLEALSRGAAAAVLVESNRRSVEVLRRNVDAVGLPGAQVVAAPVNRYLESAADAAGTGGTADGSFEAFDLIFADPPYDDAPKVLPYIAHRAVDSGLLTRDGMIVFESSSRDPRGDLAGLTSVTWVGEKRYGEALLWYGRRR